MPFDVTSSGNVGPYAPQPESIPRQFNNPAICMPFDVTSSDNVGPYAPQPESRMCICEVATCTQPSVLQPRAPKGMSYYVSITDHTGLDDTGYYRPGAREDVPVGGTASRVRSGAVRIGVRLRFAL